MQLASAGSCMATLSLCQHVREMKAKAAGCRLPAGVRTFPPDMCLPVTVLKKEITVQTLAAMALAVYSVIDRRSNLCATEVVIATMTSCVSFRCKMTVWLLWCLWHFWQYYQFYSLYVINLICNMSSFVWRRHYSRKALRSCCTIPVLLAWVGLCR